MLSPKLLNQSARPIADYLFQATPLGRLYALPSVRRALAHDAACEMLTPFVRTPDLISNEGALVEEWAKKRPAQYETAMAAWEGLSGEYVAAKHRDSRRLLRLAACRRIDATVTGNEVFAIHPTFAGFPYFVESAPELGFSIKVGKVTRSFYGTDPQQVGVPVQLRDLAIIGFVEKAILSFVPAAGVPGADKMWDDFWQAWCDVRPFRDFEATSKLSLFPHTLQSAIIFPEGDVPPGYVQRITSAELASIGVTVEQAARAGICLYEAEPVAAFFRGRPEIEQRLDNQELARKHFTMRIELARRANRLAS